MPEKKLTGFLATTGLAASLAVTPAPTSAHPLQMKVFNAGKEAIFPVTSTLVYGTHEAMLVDAQFQASYAKRVVEMIKSTGRSLKYIYISHSDPDYYFGLAEIKKAFPAARVISTAQSAYLISATKEAKQRVWKDKLGKDAPVELLVPDAVTSNEILLDGEKVIVRSTLDDPAHSYLWVPSIRSILGGIPVMTGEHLWMADTLTTDAINAWLRIITDMQSLHPARVVAGHFQMADESPEQLEFVRQYLETYRLAASTAKTSSDIVTAMTAKFPELPGRETLEFGAKIFMRETGWYVASLYPPIGRTATVNFGSAVFRLHFVDHRTMSFEDTSGAFQGVKDTVQYTAIEVSKNVFMVYWHEPSTGSNVVHVQDWNTGTVYTNIAAKGGSFTNLKGAIKIE